MRQKEKIRGMFSSRQKSVIGTGTTKKRTQQTTYWYAEEQENGVFKVQPINDSFAPSGPKMAVEMETFLQNYNPEPELYADKVLPAIQRLDKSITLGEMHRSKQEHYSAENEYNNAINIDKLCVRANFGLGLTYLDRGELSRAEDVFKRLVGINASYAPQHKHLFNEFGISLRKNGMHEQALEYYQKAESLITGDENLYLNIARVYFELGNIENCLDYLRKTLKINSDMDEARIFLNYLKSKKHLDTNSMQQILDS